MTAAYSSTPNMRPFNVLPPETSLTATNSAGAPMTDESAMIDFSGPDEIPMGLMNQILWKAARGADAVMPEPVHRLG